jgi:predicted nucleotidyltransferase
MNPDVTQLLDRFLAAADQAGLGSYSAVLYGSQARGDAVPGRSDVNVMLILDRLTATELKALGPAFRIWEAAKHAPPLLVRRDEWRRSADAYPVELTDMKASYRVLRGADPLAELMVDPAELRTALEREFRSKLMRLRRGFAAFSGRSDDLSALARNSAGPILVLLRTLLIGRGEAAPTEPGPLSAAASRLTGLDGPAVAWVLERRADEKWKCSDAEFVAYLSAVEQAAQYVDQLQTGDR